MDYLSIPSFITVWYTSFTDFIVKIEGKKTNDCIFLLVGIIYYYIYNTNYSHTRFKTC
jgi:hypothetical protein